MKYLILIFTTFLFSCERKNSAPIAISKQNAIDSFYIKDVIDNRELFKSIMFDSTIVCYNYYNGEINFYKKNGIYYTKDKTQNIVNSFYIDAFSYNQNTQTSILIGKDSNNGVNNYYKIDSLGKQHLVDSIRLNLSKIQEGGYRFSSINNQPVMFKDSNLFLVIAYNSPEDFPKWFEEKALASINFSNNKTSEIEYLFNKPLELKQHIQTAPTFCINDNIIALVYPCIDSVFTYNVDNKSYNSHPIKNPFYKKSPFYDITRWQEADYFTSLNLKSFFYEGIFFNPKTNHYILYFSPPVDDKIQVPNYDDKLRYAIVLDDKFEVISTYYFEEKFSSPTRYLSSSNGIYMPLKTKKQKNETTFKYYLFNL
ncbi:MAG: hypothetical protein V4561_09630 [Bacteroidota bacterium]